MNLEALLKVVGLRPNMADQNTATIKAGELIYSNLDKTNSNITISEMSPGNWCIAFEMADLWYCEEITMHEMKLYWGPVDALQDYLTEHMRRLQTVDEVSGMTQEHCLSWGIETARPINYTYGEYRKVLLGSVLIPGSVEHIVTKVLPTILFLKNIAGMGVIH